MKINRQFWFYIIAILFLHGTSMFVAAQPPEDVSGAGDLSTLETNVKAKHAFEEFAKTAESFEFRQLSNVSASNPESLAFAWESKPLFRFASEGTDPEMFLLLEAVENDEGSTWRFALAPMTCWAIEAKYHGQVVWNVDERLNKSSASGNYHVWFYE